jgi:hypothetical protein
VVGDLDPFQERRRRAAENRGAAVMFLTWLKCEIVKVSGHSKLTRRGSTTRRARWRSRRGGDAPVLRE